VFDAQGAGYIKIVVGPATPTQRAIPF
jgi:hypothetical protein